MVRTYRLLPALTVVGALLSAPIVSAQTATPSTLPAVDPLPGYPHPPSTPASLLQPAPAKSEFGCADLPEPYFVRDPLLDPPQLPQPGWFATADILFAGPKIVGVETNAFAPDNTLANVLALPIASLDWTVSPRIQLGYRLPDAFGDFALAYRFMATDGTSTTTGFDGPAALRSRLNLNEADFDYISHELSLAPHWDMKWHVGVRYAEVYFDSRADESGALAAAGSGVFEQRFSNSYWGIGPHAGLELQRALEGTGLSIVSRIDATTMLGRIRQGFFEEFTTLGSADTRFSGSQDVPIVEFRAGLAWCPPTLPETQVFLGYNYEEWWNVGKVSNEGTSARLAIQEVLLRITYNY